MREGHSFFDARHLVNLFYVFEQVRIPESNQMFVAFEMDIVNCIKADQGHEEANISFCKLGSTKKPILGNNSFKLV